MNYFENNLEQQQRKSLSKWKLPDIYFEFFLELLHLCQKGINKIRIYGSLKIDLTYFFRSNVLEFCSFTIVIHFRVTLCLCQPIRKPHKMDIQKGFEVNSRVLWHSYWWKVSLRTLLVETGFGVCSFLIH